MFDHAPGDLRLPLVVMQRRVAAPIEERLWSFGFLSLWLFAVTIGALGLLILLKTEFNLPAGPPPAGTSAATTIIHPNEAMHLVKAELSRLGDAIRTGDYAMFRGMASSAFQANSTEYDLSRIFALIATSDISLAAASDINTGNLQPAILEQDNRLLLRGRADEGTAPHNFDLLFEIENGYWRLFGVTIYRD
jgi:hypothetical protein